MRHLATVLLPTLLACLLAAAAGCDRNTETDRGPLVLHPTVFTPPEASRDLFGLEVYTITERLGLDGTARLDFWKLLDDASLPPAARRLLADNGLRVGTGGELAMGRIEAMLTGRRNVEIRKSTGIVTRQGYALDAPCGVAQRDMPLLMRTAEGALAGSDFALATTFLRFECLSGPEPGTIDVWVSPWILYGDKQPLYRQTPTGMILVSERPRFYFDELKTRLHLREGQLVAVGLAGGRNLSIGEHLLEKVREPYRYVTTVLMVPRLLAPGEVPPGTSVAGAPAEPGGGE